MTSAFYPYQHAESLLPSASLPDSGREEPAYAPGSAMQPETPIVHGSIRQAVIRVLVVDDHELIRRGLCAVLGEQEDFEVGGQAGKAKPAGRRAKKCKPVLFLSEIFLG